MFLITQNVVAQNGCIGFESSHIGYYGGSTGYTPGQTIFTTQGVDVSIQPMTYATGGTSFDALDIYTPSWTGIGADIVALPSNINMVFNFSSLPQQVSQVSFSFGDGGGQENISVNGNNVWIGDIENAPMNIAPNVTLQVSSFPTQTGIIGTAVFTGFIDELWIGGQEMEIDDICWNYAAENCIRFEGIATGDYNSSAYSPGDVIYTENGVPMSLETFEWMSGGSGFYSLFINNPSWSGLGFGNVASPNNINVKFDFTQLPETPAYIKLEFADGGGHENIAVNGSPLYVGELTDLPSNYFPNVYASTVTTGLYSGILELTGDIHTLTIGGQELEMDNICWEYASDYCIEFEGLTPNDYYGGLSGQSVGDVFYMEDGVPVSLQNFTDNFGTLFYDAYVTNPSFLGIGWGNVVFPSNVSLQFDFSGLAGGYVSALSFEFADGGGNENIAVNGETLYINELIDAPMNIANGVTLSFMQVNGRGTAYLNGNIHTLLIGGQELEVDNFCFSPAVVSCATPTNLQVTEATSTTALFTWNAVNGAFAYDFQGRKVGSTNWGNATVSLPETYNLGPHSPNQAYEWRVRTVCGNGTSAWSPIQTFISPACVAPEMPMNLQAVFEPNGCNTLRLQWEAVAGATSYRLAGKKDNPNAAWKTWDLTDTYRDFNNIPTGNNYRWTVQAFCETEGSGWVSPTPVFTFNSNCLGKVTGEDPFATSEKANISVFPNPAKNIVTISSDLTNEDISVEVFDIIGRKVLSQKGNDMLRLDIGHLEEGYYMLQINTVLEQKTEKLFIQR
ncbi:MAG: T9SS type A sorting domain-containing protein [Chitinophagales bacterium]